MRRPSAITSGAGAAAVAAALLLAPPAGAAPTGGPAADRAAARSALTSRPPTTPPAQQAQDEALAGTSLREDLTRERFYFVMADRFENGDPTNDDGGYGGDRLDSGLDPTHKGFYHGGDIEGVRQQLDYIEGLGTTAIWLTPSFVNRPVQGAGDAVSAGYHGYWITDFTQIDPHLGTNEELERLIDEAHARGMKVFFDIITNHTADVIQYAEGSQTYISKDAEPFRDAQGQAFDDRDYAGGTDFPALDAATSFPYTPVFAEPEDATVKVPAWLNDPTMYHNRGNARFDGGESDVYGDFSGLDDLFTARPEVVTGMEDIYKAWVDLGIDGFRIDTVKHVNIEFWQQFAPAITDHAASIGNDDFFSFGEVYDADPRALSRFTTEGALQSTIDFGFQARAQSFGSGGATQQLADLFAMDDLYTDADSNAYSLPTFLGNHDMGRIGMFLQDGGAEGDELLQRDQLAHALMYLVRGQPVVYYGDEQGFTGDGGDQDARQDMFPSQVGTYNDDVLVGTDATTAEANFDTTHPMYATIADLSALREEHPTLADGAMVARHAEDGAGVFAFSRISDDDDVEYLVATNNSDEPQTVTLDTFNRRTAYEGLWPAATPDVRSDHAQQVRVTVPPLSAAVWRASKALRPARWAPTPVFTTGAEVSGRAEVSVDVPGDGFDQVTFAARPAGSGAEWEVLGTDDNAPYRVFHDVRGLEEGAELEYRAVVRDHSGNVAGAGTTAVVTPEPGPGVGGEPMSVAIAGDLNTEIGCESDWTPDCDQAQMTYDPAAGVWTLVVAPPAGTYEYKIAVDRSWTENYGAGGVRDGGNITLTTSGGAVTFTYDTRTHLVTAVEDVVVQPGAVAVAGDLNGEMGCTADWLPSCDQAQMTFDEATGRWVLSVDVPAGSYAYKIAIDRAWTENYGAGGVPDGPNMTLDHDGGPLTFVYDHATHRVVVE
ncbi:alpha-amylase family glycosyl hydrolase [uncultured Pseudokineococcus sp.]|uniref:alpha-amylase family glycosyl hydrolase n=1 Tax=uncultured Pseudokineococcus sp. TaxID=1642928 RepID=UPI0026376305|nr:alpha-amylase family glycosyl hydrolase [uncultured Pseudokineococcus sp.]